MSFALFNTLEYVKLLMKSGFNQQQAEGLNEAQVMVMQALLSQVATKADLQNLSVELRAEIRAESQELRTEFRTDIQALRTELHKEISDIKPFVLKAVISSMLANFALMGLGVAGLALFFT